MKEILRPIKGMKDVLSEDMYIYSYLENNISSILKNNGFERISLPIIEKTDLFNKSIKKFLLL